MHKHAEHYILNLTFICEERIGEIKGMAFLALAQN